MTVLFSARQTAVATLDSVTSTVAVVAKSADALANLATVGSLYAEHYRKTTEASLNLEADELAELALDAAAARIARKQVELTRELKADSGLSEAFTEIRQRLMASRHSLKIAAE